MFLLDFFSPLRRLRRMVAQINELEPEIAKLGDGFLLNEGLKLRERIKGGEDEARALPRAFALAREAARRTLGQRHFDVQLMGGIVLADGGIAEMRTGEGKTLAATAPAYFRALCGEGVHVVTVNEYLAKRDAVWMGQIYHALGLRVACLVHEGAFMYDPSMRISEVQNIPKNSGTSDIPRLGQSVLLDKERDVTGGFVVQQEYLRPISRREAYAADITYGTNHEFGFDYLRDNLARSAGEQVQRGWAYAIVDEIDSILIDEARTPLIISAPDDESSDMYKTFARLVARLEKGEDYLVDEKFHAADITEKGIDKVEKVLGIKDLYGPANSKLTHYLQESLRAYGLYQRDRDYVVKNNEVIIVDQFTGRLMLGRRFSGGLHQAIEAKEGVLVQKESRTYAQISIQNYFRLYKKLAGMTGTAQTSAEEFDRVYRLDVVTIPTNREIIRVALPFLIYKTAEAKYAAIIEDIKKRREKGQPVLVGTVSIEKNEKLHVLLAQAGVPHEILNAKNNEREGAIIAQAGRAGAVTVATNMAGRGVDIILGGNPPDILTAQKVREVGGLHVIGTERHEARRIDNQLRGRSGRQGDPGSSQFYLSLEDDLMRVFGGDRLKGLMDRLDVPEDMPIQSSWVSRAISEAQSRVEGFNFDARKHLLEYDDVLNRQRLTIYKKRQQILETGQVTVKLPVAEGVVSAEADGESSGATGEDNVAESEKVLTLSPEALSYTLSTLDMLWMNHLAGMEGLNDAVRLRAYGQHDPLTEYKREGHGFFKRLLAEFDGWLTENAGRLEAVSRGAASSVSSGAMAPIVASSSPKNVGSSVTNVASYAKVGRNEPCPCGAKKADGSSMKYKKCHGQ